MAWIPAVVGAVASLYSSYQSGKQSKNAAKQQQQALDLQKNLLGQTTPYGKYYLEQSKQAISPAQRYYQALASGNRYLTMETLSPELNGLASRYKGTVTNQRSMYPRGGMNTATAQDLPFQYNAQASNAMFGARRDANSQLANIGQNEAGIGANLFGLSSNTINSNLDASLRIRQLAAQQSEAAGAGFFSSMQQLQNYYSNRNNGTAPSANMSTPYQGYPSSGTSPNPYQGYGPM
jgi:hypothetical protein